MGLLALPLSLVPFAAYFRFTGEGELLWSRTRVAVAPPHLPSLSKADERWARAHAPSYGGGVAVLVYHGVGSKGDESRFAVTPEQLGSQLAYLRAAGMNTVTAREVAAAFQANRPLPPRSVLLSFDDGRAEAMLWADPLLAQAHARATMFVITQAAGSRGVFYASWKQLRAYAKSGRWDLESHTAGLHRLQPVADGRQLPALTSMAPGETIGAYAGRVKADLARASDDLQKEIGMRPVAFAYPFGAYGAERVNDPRVQDLVTTAVGREYQLAFEQDDQLTVPLATCRDTRLRLRRIDVGHWSGRDLLQRITRAAAATDRAPACPS
ncbi:MAG: secreted protein [Acidimicrobiales bacterium]|nr:secreted protein [Acidimicrobiales bacterium]